MSTAQTDSADRSDATALTGLGTRDQPLDVAKDTYHSFFGWYLIFTRKKSRSTYGPGSHENGKLPSDINLHPPRSNLKFEGRQQHAHAHPCHQGQ